jgi:hypothetical protein
MRFVRISLAAVGLSRLLLSVVVANAILAPVLTLKNTMLKSEIGPLRSTRTKITPG